MIGEVDTVTKMPGRLSDRITRMRTPNQEQPSTFATSWISSEISWEKLRSVQTVNGRAMN
jgi:hypothetical protein